MYTHTYKIYMHLEMKMHQTGKNATCIAKTRHMCRRGGRQVFGKSSHHPNIFLMASISNARENLEIISHCGVLGAVTCSWQRSGWDHPLLFPPANKEIG